MARFLAVGRAQRHAAPPAQAWLAVWALLAVACASSTPPASDDDSALPAVTDDSCARFAFRFSQGGCPDRECAEPLCNCPAAIISCIPGKNERCMSGLACNVACAADPQTLLTCAIDIAPCRVDSDCSEGLCVLEPDADDGECESGERGARCRDDHDCKTGNCVAGTGGNRACSPGDLDDLCNRASDCRSGHCTLEAGAAVGSCAS